MPSRPKAKSFGGKVTEAHNKPPTFDDLMLCQFIGGEGYGYDMAPARERIHKEIDEEEVSEG